MARKKVSESDAEETIHRQLVESGERERLREKFGRQLQESGWWDQVRAEIKDTISNRGYTNVNVEDLVQEIMPKALAMVPAKSKQDLTKDVKRFLSENAEA